MTIPTYNIHIKYRTPETKRIEQLEVGDWIDLTADEDVVMRAGELKFIHLGVAMQLPKYFEAHFVPRSSTFKNYKIIQVNGMAVIDNLYCGDNDWWKFPALAMEDTHIERGARICQFRIMNKQPNIHFKEVERLGNVDRGGFGSTGK